MNLKRFKEFINESEVMTDIPTKTRRKERGSIDENVFIFVSNITIGPGGEFINEPREDYDICYLGRRTDGYMKPENMGVLGLYALMTSFDDSAYLCIIGIPENIINVGPEMTKDNKLLPDICSKLDDKIKGYINANKSEIIVMNMENKSQLSLEELESLMKKAAKHEDYKTAAEVRDTIKRRKDEGE